MQNERWTAQGTERRSANGDLPAVSPFVCPGSSQPVSRAVHLSRLNAVWPGCDQCEWHNDTEGLATRTVQDTERIRAHRLDGIRRTEFGIRGQYINDLDRRTAAELVRIFCHCLHAHPAADAAEGLLNSEELLTRSMVSRGSSAGSNADIQPALVSLSPVVVGYDGRSSSLDIFAGITSAVREFGLPVIDVGRSTAASIQEAVRNFPESSGAILITGAGMPPSWTGLDAFDPFGDSVPVVWKDFGVRLQFVSPAAPDAQASRSESAHVERDPVVETMLQRVRVDAAGSVNPLPHQTAVLRLQLPVAEQRRAWSRRLSRQSGRHLVIDFENRYRQWLLRWYPQQSNLKILVRSDDPLIRQRIAWLSEQTGMEIVGRSAKEAGDVPSCRLTITIHEDDREFMLSNGYGEPISAVRLATQLNDGIHSQAAQVTAHADAASGRFWLTDAGRPVSSRMTEHIRDGLAVTGLLVRLMESGRLSLRP